MILYRFYFHFYLLNSDIEMNYYVCLPEVPLERNVSRIFNIQGLPKKNGDPRLFSNFLAIRDHYVHPKNNGD